MNRAIKRFTYLRALANFNCFIFHFLSWRIFQSKKIAFAKILVRRLRHSSFENESELFHPFEVLMLHEFFSLKRWWWIDWVKDWSSLKEREKWVEWKATLDNMIGCFEKEWWRGNDGRKDVRAVASPRFIVPSGIVAWQCCQLAVVWLIFFFWDT